MERGCGLLVHITSLKDDYDYGCFSGEAFSFVDFLKKANQKYWQVLPLNPVDKFGSPYCNSSLFAIDPMHICLDEFLSKSEQEKKGLKKGLSLEDYKRKKIKILKRIFLKNKKSAKQIAFERENKFWLDDYASYMALTDVFSCDYSLFPKEYKNKNSKLTKKLINDEKETVNFYKFLQFVAFKQWKAIKGYANKCGIKIIGDMPFYPSVDSDIVWAHPNLFQMQNNKLDFVSGVPGDYFNKDGQIWNTPVYHVKNIKAENYEFLINRFKHLSGIFDYVRIDHFRGYESFFKIPQEKPFAKFGKWEKGAGIELFKKLKENGLTNLIAEDLGQIDEKVVTLKNKTGYPGMKVYQFGFDGNPSNPHLPFMYEKNSVAYLGTHDNDTFCGFLKAESEQTKELILKNLNLYENATINQICYSALDLMLSSNANVVILLPQDILCQGSKYRINKPGSTENNWKYELPKKFYSKSVIDYLTHAVMLYNR